MKKPFQLLIVVLFIFSIQFLNSCGAGKEDMRASFTEENSAIPPEFGKEKTILMCVIKDDFYYDKHVKSAVKNNYKGEYVFVNLQDTYSEKYSDKKIYRYIFDYNEGSRHTVANAHNPRSTTYTRKVYYIQDRLNNKFYKSGAEFPSYAKAMDAYMQNLELKRISNK